MADTGIFATTTEVQYKAGAGASSISNTETYINSYMTQAESYINAAVKFNFSDTYSTLNADVKGILKEAASDLAAVYVMNYDLSGYPSRSYAEGQIRVLLKRAEDCLNILRNTADKNAFIRGA